MLHPVTFRALAIAVCGATLACHVRALTLGGANGAVLIGRPLELSIPVTLDPGEDSPCASADLLHGDTRVRPPSVQWVPRSGGEGVLRIYSPLPVEEPAVTLNLRVGCRQATNRNFVLLAEVPSRNEASAPLAGVPAPRQQVAAGNAPAPSVPASRPEAAAPVPRAPAAAPAQAATRPQPATPAPAPEAAPQARLELANVDLLSERSPILRLTTELTTALATDAGRRDAAAALWQVLQKTPDQAVQEALRLENAEREMKSLQASTQQNAAAVAQMRGQVEQARSDRGLAAMLAAALSLLLAAILAGLAWQWYRASRMAKVGRWFEANGESTQAPLPAGVAPDSEKAVPAAAVVAAPAAAKARAAKATAAPAVAAARGPNSGWGGGEEYQASRGGSIRMVGVEELIDVHDKADFFLSIGETDQAVAVLEAHVHDQVETSALAWMDLLELYHRLGKRAEFERLRGEFRENFTAQVPGFDDFDEPSPSLESYGRALSRIVALWPSHRVLDVIEESIFRKPGLPGAEPFSLEAYRELVLLYHVARDVAPLEEGEQGAARYSDTSLQPLNALDVPEPTQAEQDLLLIPPSTPRLGVDIDLGAEEPTGELPALDFDISDRGALEPAPAIKRR
jgi:hypothetical protein